MFNNKPSNLVLINCHDLGQHLNCYGQKTVFSPNLDSLAEKGLLFENSFCTSPLCSPSRAAIYTGRYPHQVGVNGLTHSYFAFDFNPDEVHIAQRFRDNGKRSVLVGMVHETHHPEKMGFDHIAPCNLQKGESVTQAAMDCMDELAKQQKPFYLQIGYAEPHRSRWGFPGKDYDAQGVEVPGFLVDSPTAREDFAGFQGAIKKLDDHIGQLMKHLEKTNLLDDTLVIFLTDHGMPFPRAKSSLYDPGLETALIMYSKKAPWKPGTRYKGLFSNIDILPTVFDLLEIPVPENVVGTSHLKAVLGQSQCPISAIYAEKDYHDYCDPMRCVRTADYKLIVNFTRAPQPANPSQMYHPKCITKTPFDPTHAYHEPVELYNLKADPLEQNNIAQEPSSEKTVSDLLTKLHNWMIETNDPLLKGIPTPPMWQMAMDSIKTGKLGYLK